MDREAGVAGAGRPRYGVVESAGMTDTDTTTDEPIRLVVMGVAGSGKTTIGLRLADALDVEYVEADDAHPPANVEKMAAGIPLTDADRQPWLETLASRLAARTRVVVSCSALKRSYRDLLREAGQVTFVYLDLPPAVARHRAGDRTDHFMGPDMIDSQFDTLEPPTDDETDVVTVDATATPAEIVATIVDRVG